MSTRAAPSTIPPGFDSVGENWEKLRGNGDIQFAPLSPREPPQPPAWLENLREWLSDLLAPLGEALGVGWPTLRWVLLGLAVLLLALLAWRLLSPMIAWRAPAASADDGWTPERADALALLEDADALAAQGRFDEAAHLLLQRSIGQIRAARPDWLEPSSTAREIASLPELAAAARASFATICDCVERSLFALRPLDSADWQAARGAYAQFALAELVANPS